MRKFKSILTVLLAVLPAVWTATAVLFIMPDTVAAHFGVNGQVDRYGSKYEAFLMPAVILVIYGIVYFTRRYTLRSSTDDDKTLRNLDIGDTVIMLILVLLDAVDVFTLHIMTKPDTIKDPESIAAVIISVTVGIIFILIGNIMPKTKPNAFIGMRLSFAMDTDEHWYIANRAGGIAMVLSGLCTVIAGLTVRGLGYMIYMLIAMFVFLTVAIIYSYVKIKGKNK